MYRGRTDGHMTFPSGFNIMHHRPDRRNFKTGVEQQGHG